jgi:ribosomal protein S18 acetylase RimI-like enzyme
MLGVRAEAAGDTDFLFALYTATREGDFAAFPEEQRGQLLRMQFRAMRTGYQHDYPTARFEVVTLDDAPIGNIITDITPERVLYVDIAFLPRVRGLGLATNLMYALLEEPAALGIPGQVSVMMHNTASLALCRRLGFTLHEEAPPFVILRWTAPRDHPRDGTCT